MGVMFCEKECEIKKKKNYCAHFDPNKKRKKKLLKIYRQKFQEKAKKKLTTN